MNLFRNQGWYISAQYKKGKTSMTTNEMELQNFLIIFEAGLRRDKTKPQSRAGLRGRQQQ